MASQAAIEGVAANGLEWKSRGPRIRELCKRIGQARDGGITDPAVIVRTAHDIASGIRKWVDRLPEEKKEAFEWTNGEHIERIKEVTVEDIDHDAEGEIEEIVYCLNEIFDTFDYERVLVR